MSQVKRTAVLAIVMAAAFGGLGPRALGGGRAQIAAPPDVVYYNGKIATVNARFEMVQAVAVERGRIVAVGTNDAVRALARGTTALVDLQGKTVLPGFYDNHVHLGMGMAPDPHYLNLVEAASLDEVLTAVRRKAAEMPEGEWIRGELPYSTGYVHPFGEKGLPTRWDLDRVAPNHPVTLTRGTHLMVVNSLALQKAKITKDTEVRGGIIDRDANGELTGKLRETPARKLVTRVMPQSPRPDAETAKAGLRRFLEGLLAVGITSVNAAGIDLAGPDWRWVQDTYAIGGERLPRLTVQPRISPGYDVFDDLKTSVEATIRDLEAMPFRTGFGDDRLKVGAVKMSVDGAFSGPTSWTLEPYPGRPGFYGVARIPEEALYPVAKRAHDLGWQLGIHAIGDGGIQMTVNVLERILRESPRSDPRHYIHHFSVLPPEDTLEKVARLGIIVASNPCWIYSSKTMFAHEVLSGRRLETSEPQKSLISRGIRVSYGSDGNPYGPFVGIHSAVTRKNVDGKVYGPGERITLEQAIRNFTIETAYMNFDEKDRGSLEDGKWADMVVLAEDIFTVDPDRIKDLGIEKTIVGGNIVHATTTPIRPFKRVDLPWKAQPATTSSR